MPRYSEEVKEQARQLFADGMSRSTIARRLGVSGVTVGQWVNPAVKDKARARAKVWYQNNKETQKEYHKQYNKIWHQQNKEAVNDRHRKAYAADVENQRRRGRTYHANNKDKHAARMAKRRAAQLAATPPWLTDAHDEQFSAIFAEARRLCRQTGESYHVDHIVPLCAKFNNRGKQIACGLHVPWNLRPMPGSLNNSKHCRLPAPDEWTAW